MSTMKDPVKKFSIIDIYEYDEEELCLSPLRGKDRDSCVDLCIADARELLSKNGCATYRAHVTGGCPTRLERWKLGQWAVVHIPDPELFAQRVQELVKRSHTRMTHLMVIGSDFYAIPWTEADSADLKLGFLCEGRPKAERISSEKSFRYQSDLCRHVLFGGFHLECA